MLEVIFDLLDPRVGDDEGLVHLRLLLARRELITLSSAVFCHLEDRHLLVDELLQLHRLDQGPQVYRPVCGAFVAAATILAAAAAAASGLLLLHRKQVVVLLVFPGLRVRRHRCR